MPVYQQRPSSVPQADTPVAGIAGLVGFGFAIWGLVCASGIILQAVKHLVDLGAGVPAEFIQTVFLNGICGLLAGVAMAIIRSWPRRATHVEKSFVSALFNKGLAELNFDSVFWGRV